jgi:lysozyme family protein
MVTYITYRYHKLNSPYLWSYSQYYSRGGYPCDNCWSDSFVSKQAGLAVIIKALSDAAPADVKFVYDA